MQSSAVYNEQDECSRMLWRVDTLSVGAVAPVAWKQEGYDYVDVGTCQSLLVEIRGHSSICHKPVLRCSLSK